MSVGSGSSKDGNMNIQRHTVMFLRVANIKFRRKNIETVVKSVVKANTNRKSIVFSSSIDDFLE